MGALLQNTVFGKNKFKPFISTWKTDNISAGSSQVNQIKLPLMAGGVYNFTVDWGDGTISRITSWGQAEVTHTYSDVGIYQVIITGKCDGFRFANAGDIMKLMTIKRWGDFIFNRNEQVFSGCGNLTLNDVEDIPELKSVNYFTHAFRDCISITTINHLGLWDTSNVIDMRSMFFGAKKFNQDISGWDVSKVTNMSFIFYGATNFNNGGSPNINNWVTSKVTNMQSMFNGCSFFNQPIDNWDTSKVTDMGSMFYSATIFNQAIGRWDVSKVTSMTSMFTLTYSFNQPIGSWNTASLIKCNAMFNSAQAFNQPIGDWNMINVTDISNMFYDCPKFNQPIDSWNVSNVNTMYQLFTRATLFNQELNSWDIRKVTNLTNTFSYSGFNKPLSNWDVSNVTDMSLMFYNAINFDQNIGSWNVANVINFASFMTAKTPITFSAENLDAIYNGWSTRALKPNLNIYFGSAKYTSASSSARAILTSAPNNWVIQDGGMQ